MTWVDSKLAFEVVFTFKNFSFSQVLIPSFSSFVSSLLDEFYAAADGDTQCYTLRDGGDDWLALSVVGLG